MRWLAGYGITSLTSQPPTLEQVFLSHYRAQDARPAGASA
jgi:hypothetical protein